MTSWSEPDYDIKLCIEAQNYREFIELSGNVFSIKLFRQNMKRPVGGMIIINQREENEAYQPESWGNLWIDSKNAIIPIEENVMIELIDECDPMFQFDTEMDELRKKLPVKLQGKIYKREQLTDQQIIKIRTFLRGENDSL